MDIPTEFLAVRPLVILRAHGVCEGCGEVRADEVHHRQPRGMGGVHGAAAAVSNSPSNLLALCVRCHALTEEELEWAEEVGWRVPHPTVPAVKAALLYTVWGRDWFYLTHQLEYVRVLP